MKFLVVFPDPCLECVGPIAVPDDIEMLSQRAGLTEHPNSVQRCHSDECSRRNQ